MIKMDYNYQPSQADHNVTNCIAYWTRLTFLSNELRTGMGNPFVTCAGDLDSYYFRDMIIRRGRAAPSYPAGLIAVVDGGSWILVSIIFYNIKIR